MYLSTIIQEQPSFFVDFEKYSVNEFNKLLLYMFKLIAILMQIIINLDIIDEDKYNKGN